MAGLLLKAHSTGRETGRLDPSETGRRVSRTWTVERSIAVVSWVSSSRNAFPFVSRRRIWYLTTSPRPCRHEFKLPHPAHTEFVICDYAIENRLHRRRDVTLGEDHCQVCKGAAPLALAVLNNVILALFDFLGVANVKEQMRRLDAQPERAIRLVLGSLLTFK